MSYRKEMYGVIDMCKDNTRTSVCITLRSNVMHVCVCLPMRVSRVYDKPDEAQHLCVSNLSISLL